MRLSLLLLFYIYIYIYISDWIRKKVPAEFDLSLIDLDTILS